MRYDVSMEPLIQERELEGTEGNGLGSEDDDKPAAAKTPYRLPIDDLFGHGISPAAIDVIAATTDTVLLKTCAPVIYDQYKKAVVTIDDLTSRLQTDKPEIYKAITLAVNKATPTEAQLSLSDATKKLAKQLPDFVACAVVVHIICDRKNDKKAQAIQISRGWLTVPLESQDEMLQALRPQQLACLPSARTPRQHQLSWAMIPI